MPAPRYRSTFCKHMAAVEDTTEDGTLEAFPSADDEKDEDESETAECDCDGLGGFPC
ncbi:SWIM zinc finger family protein [Haladaptatus pallidirubidus]|nr:SWIM zinc finger family protein [Haladaptatus pallidirubidus]